MAGAEVREEVDLLVVLLAGVGEGGGAEDFAAVEVDAGEGFNCDEEGGLLREGVEGEVAAEEDVGVGEAG